MLHLLVESTPDYYFLFQNYPNPFNPSTKIFYSILVSDHVNLKIFNILGREVQTLVDTFQDVGEYTIDFDAQNLSSGVYFYKLKVGDPSKNSGQGFTKTKKMILMR